MVLFGTKYLAKRTSTSEPRSLPERTQPPHPASGMTEHPDSFLELQAALAGEYCIQRALGRGGMGIVYLARDVQLDRDVAINVVPRALAATAAPRRRSARGAARAAA